MTTTALLILLATTCVVAALALAFAGYCLWENEKPSGLSFAFGALSAGYGVLAVVFLLGAIFPGTLT